MGLTSPLEDHFIVALETIAELAYQGPNPEHLGEIAREALDIAAMHVEHRRIHGQLDRPTCERCKGQCYLDRECLCGRGCPDHPKGGPDD